MRMNSSTPLKISATTSKISKTLKSLFQENQISISEMPSIFSILTEVEEFLQLNFIVDLMLLVFTPLMKRLIFSLLDTIALVIESSMLENSRLLSLLMMLLLTPKLPEDHLTIHQDQSEEMTASNQELLMNSAVCGEQSSESKMPQKMVDKDLLLDQVLMPMKLSTPLMPTVVDLSALTSS